MIVFEHIEFLIGLAVLLPMLLLFIYVNRWKRKVKKQIGDEELVDKLTENFSSANFRYKFYLLVAAIALCIIAAINVRTPKTGRAGKRSGIDVMVALDVSNSMLAQDIKPNRLERAKQLLNKMVEKIGDNRMGLVVFAGQAYLQTKIRCITPKPKPWKQSGTPPPNRA